MLDFSDFDLIGGTYPKLLFILEPSSPSELYDESIARTILCFSYNQIGQYVRPGIMIFINKGDRLYQHKKPNHSMLEYP
jgi:hypothetical protein